MADRPHAKTAYSEPLANRIIDDLIRSWVQVNIGMADATADTEEHRQGVQHAAAHLDEHWVHLVPDIVDALRRAGQLRTPEES